MDDKNISLKEFVTTASTVLLEAEKNLQKLAQLALLNEPLLANTYSTRGDEQMATHLNQVSQQLTRLSQRSHMLRVYLQNGLASPLANDEQWPLIRILQSHEEERTQMARELEDSLGQLLANSVVELASCRQLLPNDNEAVSIGLDALQIELEQGLADVRWFIAELEPMTILNRLGLGGGIKRYLERYENRTGLQTQLQLKANIKRLPTVIEIAIFRIIQESLSNVYRHANATEVQVVLSENEEILQFSVIDNGRGFILDNLGKSRKNMGLARMVDYAELLNGKLKILSEPGQGTQVSLSIPYPLL